MTVRMQLVFEDETMEGIVTAARRWLDARPGLPRSAAETEEARRERELREVLGAIRGPDSRRLVRELAEAAVRGEAVPFNADLKARYGKASGTAFAGTVSGPNKLMRRVAHRDLIVRDAAMGGYRMDPLDAHVVLAAWATPAEGRSGPQEPPTASDTRPRGSTTGGARPRGRAAWP
jgi:hypothetical protein